MFLYFCIFVFLYFELGDQLGEDQRGQPAVTEQRGQEVQQDRPPAGEECRGCQEKGLQVSEALKYCSKSLGWLLSLANSSLFENVLKF